MKGGEQGPGHCLSTPTVLNLRLVVLMKGSTLIRKPKDWPLAKQRKVGKRRAGTLLRD